METALPSPTTFPNARIGGEDLTAIFLTFRTRFALGLVGMGVGLWQEKS